MLVYDTVRKKNDVMTPPTKQWTSSICGFNGVVWVFLLIWNIYQKGIILTDLFYWNMEVKQKKLKCIIDYSSYIKLKR